MDDGFYEIIAGERRWRAARLAGLKEVPVRIIEADDRLASELALVENLQREDLNPIEEAKGYKSLIEEYGMTQDEVAKRIGRSRPAITNAIRLLSLSSEISELVEKGQLSAGHARALLPVKDVKKQQELANAIINKGYSVRHAEKMAAETLKPAKEKETESKSVSPDYAKYVSDALSDILGRKVVLYDGKKTGKIELTFYGPDDREALIEELKKIGKL
jgi:ParB family chromosome partitioning protein